MAFGRRGGGFKSVGSVPPERLGLPDRRAIELRLSSAWAECVGPVLAERTQALGVQRGVLEVRLSDPAWIDPVSELMPGLAGRLAKRAPGFRIRSCRLIVDDGKGAPVKRRFELDPDARMPEPRPKSEPPPPPRRPGETDPAKRLRGLAERYLDRAARKPRQNP